MISATDQRRKKVASEISRPTFARLKPPMPQDLPPPPPLPSCGGGWSRSGGRIRYMKPEFISEIAKAHEPEYS
jgi:hypothetical protein